MAENRKNTKEKQYVIKKLQQTIEEFIVYSLTIAKKSANVQSAFIDNIVQISKMLVNNSFYADAEKMIVLLSALKKSKKVRIRISAEVERKFLTAYIALWRNEKSSVDLFRETIKRCLKYRYGFKTAMLAVYYEIYGRRRYSESNDVFAFIAQFVPNEKKREDVFVQIVRFMDYCIEGEDDYGVTEEEQDKAVWDLLNNIKAPFMSNYGINARQFYKFKKIEDLYQTVFKNIFSELISKETRIVISPNDTNKF